jgi:hypothetical protein
VLEKLLGVGYWLHGEIGMGLFKEVLREELGMSLTSVMMANSQLFGKIKVRI